VPAPATQFLRVDRDGRVATVVLDRPDVLNALSVALLDELVAVLAWLETRDEVRVIVLRGAGRAFSAGADLATVPEILADDAAGRRSADAGNRAASAIERARAVTIAAVHGRCVGGGVVLALACDLRIAAESSRFSVPELDLGIPLAWGGIPRLLREVPPAVARDLVLTGREFGAREAQMLGLIPRVHADETFDGEVAALAAEVAGKAALPVRATLDAVAATLGIGAPLGWSDADTLLTAIRDPESREVARRYLARW